MKERTVALIKPDAIRRRLCGRIIHIIEREGFDIRALRWLRLTADDAMEFYSEHEGKPYFADLVSFTASGPIIALVLQGDSVIMQWRRLMGPSDPDMRKPGQIRHAFMLRGVPHKVASMENLVHGSDSPQAYEREAAILAALPHELDSLPAFSR